MLLQRQALRRAATSRICANRLRCNSTAASPSPADRQPEVIFSGIQPTGVPHIGNYLGALREWVRLQNTYTEAEKLFCVVDLHAVTVRQDANLLRRRRKEMLASFMAVGLDRDKSLMFCQSSVPEHAELMWLLSCNASMGYLSRMTQWKSKLSLPPTASPFDAPPSSNSREAVKLGLFSYPVLQAADILLYGATHVPVGEDQAQHLEFTRELAQGFNAAFALNSKRPLLIPPKTILSPAKRVMSLQAPTKKMSKSDTQKRSQILITDSKEQIRKKIMSAKTDSKEGISYDRVERPGVSNLINLMHYMDESVAPSPEDLAADMKDLSMRALKERVADTVDANIKEIRERYEEVMSMDKNRPFLLSHNARAARAASTKARISLTRIKQAMGLYSVAG